MNSSNQLSNLNVQNLPEPQHNSNNQVNLDENNLRTDIKSVSIKPAVFINRTLQKSEDAEMILGQKMFKSKINKKIQIVKGNSNNKELIILIKQLISLFMIMTTNVKTCSTGSKIGSTKICLAQTLKKLRQLLTKQQMKVLLTNLKNRQLKMEQSQKSKTTPGKVTSGLYQKSI